MAHCGEYDGASGDENTTNTRPSNRTNWPAFISKRGWLPLKSRVVLLLLVVALITGCSLVKKPTPTPDAEKGTGKVVIYLSNQPVSPSGTATKGLYRSNLSGFVEDEIRTKGFDDPWFRKAAWCASQMKGAIIKSYGGGVERRNNVTIAPSGIGECTLTLPVGVPTNIMLLAYGPGTIFVDKYRPRVLGGGEATVTAIEGETVYATIKIKPYQFTRDYANLSAPCTSVAELQMLVRGPWVDKFPYPTFYITNRPMTEDWQNDMKSTGSTLVQNAALLMYRPQLTIETPSQEKQLDWQVAYNLENWSADNVYPILQFPCLLFGEEPFHLNIGDGQGTVGIGIGWEDYI